MNPFLTNFIYIMKINLLACQDVPNLLHIFQGSEEDIPDFLKGP